jgi:hypothetical protein
MLRYELMETQLLDLMVNKGLDHRQCCYFLQEFLKVVELNLSSVLKINLGF